MDKGMRSAHKSYFPKGFAWLECTRHFADKLSAQDKDLFNKAAYSTTREGAENAIKKMTKQGRERVDTRERSTLLRSYSPRSSRGSLVSQSAESAQHHALRNGLRTAVDPFVSLKNCYNALVDRHEEARLELEGFKTNPRTMYEEVVPWSLQDLATNKKAVVQRPAQIQWPTVALLANVNHNIMNVRLLQPSSTGQSRVIHVQIGTQGDIDIRHSVLNATCSEHSFEDGDSVGGEKVQHFFCPCVVQACNILSIDPKQLVPYPETVEAWELQIEASGDQNRVSDVDLSLAPKGSLLKVPHPLPQRGQKGRAFGWRDAVLKKDRTRAVDRFGRVVREKSTRKRKARSSQPSTSKTAASSDGALNDVRLAHGISDSMESSSSGAVSSVGLSLSSAVLVDDDEEGEDGEGDDDVVMGKGDDEEGDDEEGDDEEGDDEEGDDEEGDDEEGDDGEEEDGEGDDDVVMEKGDDEEGDAEEGDEEEGGDITPPPQRRRQPSRQVKKTSKGN